MIWEYKELRDGGDLRVRTIDQVNELGSQGWEMIHVRELQHSWPVFWFKRAVLSETEAK